MIPIVAKGDTLTLHFTLYTFLFPLPNKNAFCILHYPRISIFGVSARLPRASLGMSRAWAKAVR